MRVSLLGPVRVDGDADALSPRDRTVLSALAITTDRAASVELLSEALWGDEPPASSVKIVHGCISRLRKLLGPDAIETTPDGYHLVLPDGDLDLRRFESMVAHARELLALAEPDRAEHVLAKAIALWHGHALAELDDWDHGRVERQRLGAVLQQAQELRVDALLRAGRPRDGLGPAVRLVDEGPLREDRWALLARAQYQCGRPAEALETIERARGVLARELGLDLGPALEDLQQQILVHDDALVVPEVRTTGSVRCPWPGLVAFDSADAEDFFGREEEIETCLQRLRDDGLLVVAGPSGSGKSSLVRAGVATRLRDEGADVVVLTASPKLDRELPGDERRPDVVIIDQLEALTAADVDDGDRERVVATLASAVYRSALVLVVRSDRLGEFAAGPVAGIVERGLLLLGPLDEEALRRVIEEPARRAGLIVEPGLVDLLAREVTREPGALPMLSHVLRGTWERRQGRTLTVEGYTAAGGIRGAVARTAEDVHARMDEPRRAVMRDLLLRMVTVGEDGALVAVPLPRSHIDEDPARRAIAERLVDARLLTAGQHYLSLAHESLARQWPRLQSWLDEDVAGQRLLRHLSVSATAWDELGRPDSELYRGVRLAETQEWRDRQAPRLTGVEEAFLTASIEHAAREQRQVEARAERTARTNRRLRRALRVGTALGLVALLAGLVAAVSAVRADNAATAADARRLGAQALATGDLNQALQRGVEAVELDDTHDTRASLLELLGRSPAVIGAIRPDGVGGLGTVSISADGRVLATYDDTNTLRFIDVDSRGVQATLPFRDTARGSDEQMRGITAPDVSGKAAFHPDGGDVVVTVTTAGDQPVRLLDPVSFEERSVQPTGYPSDSDNLLPWDAAWSPDGRRFAVVFDRFEGQEPPAQDSLLLVWHVADLAAPTVVELPSASHSLAWSSDGALLYVGTEGSPPATSFTPTTQVVDPDNATVVHEIRGVGHPIALHPEGTLLAGVGSGPSGSGVVVVNVTGETRVAELDNGAAAVGALAFSDDGSLLAAGSDDGSIAVWDMPSTELAERLEGHGGAVGGLVFSPDGTTLATVGTDRLTLLWDLTGGERFVRLLARTSEPPHGAGLFHVRPIAVVSPSGLAVAYVGATQRERGGVAIGGQDVTIQVLDVSAQLLSPPQSWNVSFPWVSVHWLDDNRLLLGDRGGRVTVWDTHDGVDRMAEAQLEALGTVGAAPGRERIVSINAEAAPHPYMSVLSTSTWEAIGPSNLLHEDLMDVNLSRYSNRSLPVSNDGSTAATFGGRHPRLGSSGLIVAPPTDVLVVLDVERRQVVHLVDLGFDAIAAAFSPDDQTLAVVGRRGRVALVNVSTGTLVAPPAIGHDGDARSVTWVGESPDRQIVATGGDDGRVALWDGTTGASLGRIAVAAASESTFVGTRPGTDTVVVATSSGDFFGFNSRSDCWIATARRIAGQQTDDDGQVAAGHNDHIESCDR